MSEQNNERTYQDSGTRAGGDVVTKSASQRPVEDETSNAKRAGGDVVTKSASQGPVSDESVNQDSSQSS